MLLIISNCTGKHDIYRDTGALYYFHNLREGDDQLGDYSNDGFHETWSYPIESTHQQLRHLPTAEEVEAFKKNGFTVPVQTNCASATHGGAVPMSNASIGVLVVKCIWYGTPVLVGIGACYSWQSLSVRRLIDAF